MRVYKRGDTYHLDVTINGVRYREALDTGDHREAKSLAATRVGEIQQGKGASTAGREFSRLQFNAAADLFTEERKPHVSERTHQLDRERLRPLRAYFGDRVLRRIKASDISAYQRARLAGAIALGSKKRGGDGEKAGVGNRTINMELSVLRLMMRRAKTWNIVAEDVRMLTEKGRTVAKVLSSDQKAHLFKTAAKKDRWLVVHCAAVLAASTTCRGVELKNLRWQDVDLFERVLNVRRSKTEAGLRVVPLTSDALEALSRLKARADREGANEPEHYVFPTCESGIIEPAKPQKSWRTAWRSLVREAAKDAAGAARKLAKANGTDEAEAAKRAAEPFEGFRFHDLRHQAITEMAEAGASDATLMAMAGHMTRQMLEHYSHVRMEAKRAVVAALDTGGALMARPLDGVLARHTGSIPIN